MFHRRDRHVLIRYLATVKKETPVHSLVCAQGNSPCFAL
jgi:hypothetical protein